MRGTKQNYNQKSNNGIQNKTYNLRTGQQEPNYIIKTNKK